MVTWLSHQTDSPDSCNALDSVTVNSDGMRAEKKLIAKFMGLDFVTVGYTGTASETKWQKKNKEWFDSHYEFHDHSVGDYAVNVAKNIILWQEDLNYDTSWNDLIPVVEKINEIGVWTIRPGFAAVENPKGELRSKHKFKFVKSDHDFEEVNGNPVDWIIVVHAVAVEFIHWHNQQKP